jgi:hypothetical protein
VTREAEATPLASRISSSVVPGEAATISRNQRFQRRNPSPCSRSSRNSTARRKRAVYSDMHTIIRENRAAGLGDRRHPNSRITCDANAGSWSAEKPLGPRQPGNATRTLRFPCRSRGMISRFTLLCIVVSVACASASDDAKIHAYCQRWSAKYLAVGSHANPAAYREDLMSTCMALKGTTYQPEDTPVAGSWTNPSVPPSQFPQLLGRDKANCLERGYVGQSSRGRSDGRIVGNGYGVGGRASSSYDSKPAFSNDLFIACMNAAGWQLSESR